MLSSAFRASDCTGGPVTANGPLPMRALPAALLLLLAACAAPTPEGLAPAEDGSGPKVVFDVYRLPLPELPLPNDFATRFDGNSPTHRRLNASIEAAPTQWEQHTRAELDKLSRLGHPGAHHRRLQRAARPRRTWCARHQSPTDFADDAVYVFDVTDGSPELLPAGAARPRAGALSPVSPTTPTTTPTSRTRRTQTLAFEETEEDLNDNGVLDPGEDTDMDGVLDHPNTLDGHDRALRRDRLLRERDQHPHRAAALPDARGHHLRGGADQAPGGHRTATRCARPSPTSTTPRRRRRSPRCPSAWRRLNLSLDDVAFTWTFTTQSTTADYQAIRDGLYGLGAVLVPLAAVPRRSSPRSPTAATPARTRRTPRSFPGPSSSSSAPSCSRCTAAARPTAPSRLFADWLAFVDFYAAGSFVSPQFFPRNDSEGNPLPFYDQTLQHRPGARRGLHPARDGAGVPLGAEASPGPRAGRHLHARPLAARSSTRCW